MKRLAAVIASLVIGATTLLATSVEAFAAAATVTRTPFSSFAFNQCAGGELIELSGTEMVISHVSDNGEHARFEFRQTDTNAIAPASGVKYVALTGSAMVQNVDLSDSAPLTLTIPQRIRFIRQGEDPAFPSGDDFSLRVLVHLTVNANGDVAVQVSDFDLTCS